MRTHAPLKTPEVGAKACTSYHGGRWYPSAAHSACLHRTVQLSMARAAIGWGVRELAEKAGVTANTVTRIENGADAKQSTIDALQRALEAAGIEFTNGDQPGVRLTKAAAARSAEPGSAQSRRVAAKVVRGKTAKANEKKR